MRHTLILLIALPFICSAQTSSNISKYYTTSQIDTVFTLSEMVPAKTLMYETIAEVQKKGSLREITECDSVHMILMVRFISTLDHYGCHDGKVLKACTYRFKDGKFKAEIGYAAHLAECTFLFATEKDVPIKENPTPEELKAYRGLKLISDIGNIVLGTSLARTLDNLHKNDW